MRAGNPHTDGSMPAFCTDTISAYCYEKRGRESAAGGDMDESYLAVTFCKCFDSVSGRT